MACENFGVWFTVNFAISEKQFTSQKTLMEDFVSVGLLSTPPFSQYPEIERWKNFISAKEYHCQWNKVSFLQSYPTVMMSCLVDR
jgi:hypothetical protein